MAGYAHTIRTTVTVDNATFSSSTKTYTSNGLIQVDETVAASATNLPIDMDFAAFRVVSLVMVSTRDVTVKTNDSGSPQDTFALKAGVELIWNTDHLEDLVFSDDITGLFITNAGEDDARFKMTLLLDAAAEEG